MPAASSKPELLTLDAQLATVQEDIENLTSILEEKKRMFHDLWTRRKRRASRNIPAVQLGDFPPEIIGRVLQMAVSSAVDGPEREAQMNRLRLVSIKWNTLVLHNPAFWSDVTLMLDHERQWAPAVERATSNLENHKSFFLHVEIRTSESLKPLIASFLETHSPRISSLTFCLLGVLTEVVAVLNDIAVRAPWKSLQSMTILWCGPSTANAMRRRTIELKNEHYPTLQKLELGGHCRTLCNIPDSIYSWERSLEQWQAPYSQLTSITLSNMYNTLADHLTALKPCVKLAQLSVRVNTKENNDTFSWDLNHEPVTLPMLRHLDLHVSVRCSVRHGFINRLTLPSIQSIIYSDHFQHESDEPSEYSSALFLSLSNLIKRSTPGSLESFKIKINDRLASLDEEALVDFLQFTPQLKNLAVSAPNLTCDFLLYQDEEENNCMLPPSLERLHITALQPVEAHVVEKQFKEWISWCEEDDGLHSPSWKGIHGKRSRTCINATLEIEEVVTREANRSVPMWSDRP